MKSAKDVAQSNSDDKEESKTLGAKVVKLQKLLRRAEQMIAENKKQHKDMQVVAEQDKAKIAALEVQIAQMVTRGLKGEPSSQIDPKSASVVARVSVLDTLWCFLLPAGIADRDPTNGVWMRQADFAADGGNTDEGLPQTIEEACEQQHNTKLAEHA